MKRFIREQTLRRWEALDTALQSANGSAAKPDQIHGIRVAARRLQQCLRLFSEFFDPESISKLQRRLRTLMKHCAAVRNCDVALELLTTTGVRDAPLRKQIREQRQAFAQELTAHFDKWQRKRSPKLHETAPSKGKWNLRYSPTKNAHRVLPPMTQEWFDAGDAAARKGSAYESMHRFRLLGKRLRYTLELFEDIYGSSLKPHLRQLRSAQDKLGAINDCVTSLPLMKDHPRAEAALKKLLSKCERAFRTHWLRTLAKQRDPWSTWLVLPPL